MINYVAVNTFRMDHRTLRHRTLEEVARLTALMESHPMRQWIANCGASGLWRCWLQEQATDRVCSASVSAALLRHRVPQSGVHTCGATKLLAVKGPNA